MSNELEDRISEWVDERVAGVAPVTMEEVVGGRSTTADRSAAGTDRRRWLVPAIAAAAVLVVGAVAGLVVLGGDDAPEQVVVGGPTDEVPAGTEQPDAGDDEGAPDGWTTFTEPTFGWTWERPAVWSSQSERNYCRVFGMSGTFITNTAQRYSHPMIENGCSGHWVLPKPLPGGFVGVAVVSVDETLEMLGDFPADETGFPLALNDLPPMEPDDAALAERLFEGSVPPTRSLVINHQQRRYVVTTFEGSDVSNEDAAALERVIGSIDPADLPAADPIEFGWLPAGATVVAGTPPPVSATARLEFVDGGGGVDESRSVRVDARTIRGALLFARTDMDSDAPEVQPELLPGVTPSRERILLRGIEVVHDRAVDGDTSVSRLVFFDYDNLAVEVLAQNVPDDELYQIIEGLQLVAVGGPNG